MISSIAADAELIEAEAWAQMHAGLPPALAHSIGAAVHRAGRVTSLIATRVDVAALNRVIGLGMEHPLDAAGLARANAPYRDAQVKRWLVEWSMRAMPLDGHRLLVREGGVARTPTVKLYGRLTRRDEPHGLRGISVVEIGRELADVYLAIVAPALGAPALVAPGLVSTVGMPGWHFYLAYEADRPISGAALFAMDRGAWFGACATIPEARGRGAQTALLARRAADAIRLGCDWVTAETQPDTAEKPNPSLRNLRRAGLDVLYGRAKYVFQQSDDQRDAAAIA